MATGPCVLWPLGRWHKARDYSDWADRRKFQSTATVGWAIGQTALLLFLSSSTDVLASGVWPLLSNLDDPELRRLAAA